MSISSYLQNLHNKPDHVHRRFAFLVSFIFTFIIFVFWINSLGSNKTNFSKINDNIQSPGRSLVANVGSFIFDIKDIFFGTKKVNYSNIEVVPGRK